MELTILSYCRACPMLIERSFPLIAQWFVIGQDKCHGDLAIFGAFAALAVADPDGLLPRLAMDTRAVATIPRACPCCR
ncbi:hypothetical protein N8I74_12190 [Chitiniphilus purpureus]|uniref:Uncharacterized protein n=1 Tax=Chitiniphilus purpureus TaxID=2981137 RepID=A0ABY6DIB4_9NEIS|nr:hypothetical protein [Chitiniphilus sp. CD1]UXY14079.1 hypothetical protein N8I74_12190 [Chitiniphilus sp. CD1]